MSQPSHLNPFPHVLLVFEIKGGQVTSALVPSEFLLFTMSFVSSFT